MGAPPSVVTEAAESGGAEDAELHSLFASERIPLLDSDPERRTRYYRARNRELEELRPAEVDAPADVTEELRTRRRAVRTRMDALREEARTELDAALLGGGAAELEEVTASARKRMWELESEGARITIEGEELRWDRSPRVRFGRRLRNTEERIADWVGRFTDRMYGQ